nr:MAG TPA: hypothetical protein [Caudoviricetes sp.]
MRLRSPPLSSQNPAARSPALSAPYPAGSRVLPAA